MCMHGREEAPRPSGSGSDVTVPHTLFSLALTMADFEPSQTFHDAAAYLSNAPSLSSLSNNAKLEVRMLRALTGTASHLTIGLQSSPSSTPSSKP